MAPKFFDMKEKKTTIPMCNFPREGKLCNVNTETKSFRVGRLSLQMPQLVEKTTLKSYKMFLENFAVMESAPKELPIQYQEEVSIRYYDGIGSEARMTNGSFTYKDFLGLIFYNKRGILLEVGIESTGDENVIEYVFRYHPKNLTSNTVDSLDIFNAVNSI